MKRFLLLFLFTLWVFPADARMKNVDGVDVPLTAAEETQRDAEEAAWAAGAASRAMRPQREALEAEAVVRIKAEVPGLDTIASIKSYTAFWEVNPPGSPTAAQIKAKDIHLWVRNTARPKLNAMTDAAVIRALDFTDNDPWGDGTVWP